MAASNTMINTTIFRPVILILFWLWLPGHLSAQTVSATASLDSTLMIIGGQMDLKLEVVQPVGLNVAFPFFADTITANIEIVESGKIDTTAIDGDRIAISQAFTITSFDSGLHYLPPIHFEYMEGAMERQASTQSMAILVVNPFEEVDPEKGIFDIKTPYNLPFIISELFKYHKWVVMFFLLQALIALVIIYLQRTKKPLSQIFVREKPMEPAHIMALRELDKIKKEKLWQAGQIKTFYSQLTDVLRRYLEERYHFQAMEQTSGEIMDSIKRIELPDKKLYDKLHRILQTGDLAKFAKHEPLPDENDLSIINAYFFVNQTKEEPLLTADEAAMESLAKEKAESAL
jgi:hypothetical protein